VEEGSQKKTYSLGDVTQLLQGSATDIEKDDIDSAVDKLNEILAIWPNVEAEVSTRDSKLYGDMETKVPTAISLLQSKKVNSEEAKGIVSDLNTRLLPLIDDTGCPFTGRVGSTLDCSYIIVFPKENRASGQTKMDLDRSWCGFSCQFHIGSHNQYCLLTDHGCVKQGIY
jgi:hypothetical protein